MGMQQSTEQYWHCRLPSGEVLRPKAPELMDFVHNAMCFDNEENALLCLRICFDLHRTFRPALENKIKRFLDWVKQVSPSCSHHLL